MHHSIEREQRFPFQSKVKVSKVLNDLRAVELKHDCTGHNTTIVYSLSVLQFPMSTTPSDIWENILEGNVEKDDPLWKLYLDKAAAFDARMVDEWNKIVDVLLVYVGYFLLPAR